MPRFDVNFADPKRFFYPGETVAGTITVRVDEPIRTRQITVQFEGKCHISWHTGHGKDMKFHWNSEDYFKHKSTLLAPTSPPEEGISLQVGDYTYPFQYRLPAELPPSYTTCWNDGYVLYCMKVFVEDLDSPSNHPDESISFKVVSTPVNLNETRHLLEPKSETVEKFLCCLCCQSGPILLHVELQKQAFHVEEKVIFSFDLDNKATDQPLRKIEAKIMKRETYYSASRTEERDSTISSIVLSEAMPPGGEGTWKDVRLDLPPDIVPSFECKCLLVEYYFNVSVDIESAFDPKMLIPITIVNGVKTEQPECFGLLRSENQPPIGPPPLADQPLPINQPSHLPDQRPPAGISPPEHPPPPYSSIHPLSSRSTSKDTNSFASM